MKTKNVAEFVRIPKKGNVYIESGRIRTLRVASQATEGGLRGDHAERGNERTTIQDKQGANAPRSPKPDYSWSGEELAHCAVAEFARILA